MTALPFDPAPGARRLARAWQDGGQIASLPQAERPDGLPEAYRMQRRLGSELGEPVRGYKLGMSSPAAMERSGLGQPLIGFMPTSRLLGSGATLRVPGTAPLLIEVEVALVLDAGTAPEAPVPGAACLAIEVVRSRFADRGAVGMPSFVADAAGFHAAVLGDPIPIDAVAALLRAGGSLVHDGRTVASATTGRDCPDPFAALRRLAALAPVYGLALAPGMVVATGNIVTTFETSLPGVFEGRLGDAMVRITIESIPE